MQFKQIQGPTDVIHVLVMSFLFGKNSHQPKFVSAGSENVFCVFLNKEIRY